MEAEVNHIYSIDIYMYVIISEVCFFGLLMFVTSVSEGGVKAK